MSNALATVLGRAVYSSHPVYGAIELTYVCNMHCRFCYNPVERRGQERTQPLAPPSGPPLEFAEILSVMDQLRAMGVLYLTLTGGEPLVHPRFWDIAEEAKKRSFAVRIFTNGIAIDERVADRLAALGPYCLEISMHGATDATAEALNQVPGSHQKLLRALGLLRDRGLRVYLKCVVTRLIEHELFEMKAIADSFGFPLFFDPILTLADDGDAFPLDLAASDEVLRSLYAADGLNIGNSPFERAAEDLNCTVATGFLHVGPYGDVQPCTQWKESGGNIRTQTLQDIWWNSPVFQYAREINHKLAAGMKDKTPDHEFCFQCPALSKLHYGDAERPEEQYLRLARIRKQVKMAEEPGSLVPSA